MSEDRLTRIEDKLDKMSEAITLLARMEERMVTLFKRMDKYDENQTKLADRVGAVEKVTLQRGVVYHLLDKGFWLVVGAGLTWITKYGGGS
jgi:hypothetical protein